MYASGTFISSYISTDKRLILKDIGLNKVGGFNVCQFNKAMTEGKFVWINLMELRIVLDFASEADAKVALLNLETAIEELAVNCVYAPASQYSSNVTVTASGTDTYTGVATPTQTAYDISVIYITTFANANTTTTPTLDIDGIGVMTIVKSDETGIIPLEVGDIQPSVAYFLVDNGTDLQLFTQAPTALPNTYTNLNPVPVTLGGVIIGTTFNNVTMSSVFDMLLYPYLVPNFTAFAITGQSTNIEVGSSIAAGSKTFTWSTSNSGYVAANTIRITDVTGGNVIILNNSPNDGTQAITFASAITKSIPATHTWTIRGTRTNSSYMTKNFSVSWNYKLYYGTDVATTITEAQAEAMTAIVTNTAVRTYTFAGGGYKYFVVPNNCTNPTLFKDQATGLSVGMADSTDGYTDTNAGVYPFKFLTITNAFSITQTYRVYRTKNILGGAINIVVS